MLPAFGMVILPQNPSTENGHVPGWSSILSVGTVAGGCQENCDIMSRVAENGGGGKGSSDGGSEGKRLSPEFRDTKHGGRCFNSG